MTMQLAVMGQRRSPGYTEGPRLIVWCTGSCPCTTEDLSRWCCGVCVGWCSYKLVFVLREQKGANERKNEATGPRTQLTGMKRNERK